MPPEAPPALALTLSPHHTEAFLLRLSDPGVSFNELVSGYNTTPAALSAFMARPDIAARILELESAAATKARLIASSLLPTAAVALRLDLQQHINLICNVPINDRDPHAVERRQRAMDRGRKAVNLVMRLARFTPADSVPVRPPRQSRPAPPSAPGPDPKPFPPDAPGPPTPVLSPAPSPMVPTGLSAALVPISTGTPQPQSWSAGDTLDLRAAHAGDPPPIKPPPTGVWLPFESSPSFPTAWLQPPKPAQPPSPEPPIAPAPSPPPLPEHLEQLTPQRPPVGEGDPRPSILSETLSGAKTQAALPTPAPAAPDTQKSAQERAPPRVRPLRARPTAKSREPPSPATSPPPPHP